MPAEDTSYSALDAEVTKLREGSLLRCERSYECLAGDPDVSSSTLLRLRMPLMPETPAHLGSVSHPSKQELG